MKKFKVILFTIVIAMGIGGAYASTQNSCEYYPQYRYFMGYYYPAGEYGSNFACYYGGGICTYYKPSLFSPYMPCHFGAFLQL